MVTMADVQSLARTLPRSTEVMVRGRLKFRVAKIVYLSFSPDETVMGFGFPKEWRHLLVEAEPDKFMLPIKSDMRFNWVHAQLEQLDETEMRELVLDAWRMVVPKSVAAAYDAREAAALHSGFRTRRADGDRAHRALDRR
jgi:hypothetical protein